MENLLDRTTQLWVKLTGRKIDPIKHSWLIGPTGDPDIIGEHFIDRLANTDQLIRSNGEPDAGLIENMDELQFTKDERSKLNPEIIDLYEHTSTYEFEFWSSWCGVFRPFGWLLSVLFSKRLEQLNLPLNPMDSAKGLKSEIIKLKKNGKTIWTIWFRTLRSTKRVIYAGVYTTCNSPNYSNPLLKVVFPLPNGNATVIMTKQVKKDGSLLFSSDGRIFGENGFYFTLTNNRGMYWAKYVKSMHEWIHVYLEDDRTLRADHILNFYGIRFLNLHYKMKKRVANRR